MVKKSSSGSKRRKQNGQMEVLCFSISHPQPEGDPLQSFSAFFFFFLFIHLHVYKWHAHTSFSWFSCFPFFSSEARSPAHRLNNAFPSPLPSWYICYHPFGQISGQCLHCYNCVNIKADSSTILCCSLLSCRACVFPGVNDYLLKKKKMNKRVHFSM